MPKELSIIVPCYNEAHRIWALLEAIAKQTFPLDRLEIIIADGMSTDGTRSVIEAFARQHPQFEIRIVDNQERTIPAALNCAIQVSTGEIVIRLDAHSAPFPDYVDKCVHLLNLTGAANVGGVWLIEPSESGLVARGIASAAAHPLGAGGARYRTSGEAGEVETVPFGAFPREWLDRIGPFNEELLTNEDYEYNVRIRNAGGKVWFDPSIRSVYFARGSYDRLAKQYARYGYWKAKMLQDYPETLRWRQALPPLFILLFLLLLILSIFWIPARWLLGVQLVAYLLITILGGISESVRRRDLSLMLGFPPALWIMHFTWGSALIWSSLEDLFSRHRDTDEN